MASTSYSGSPSSSIGGGGGAIRPGIVLERYGSNKDTWKTSWSEDKDSGNSNLKDPVHIPTVYFLGVEFGRGSVGSDVLEQE